ncbi:hypothetical protein [Oenococcus oeni]|uniref:hypothetical protein n=1 Tax=Oenococcus oeni TaxID=1247 RepID=UPI0008F8A4F5|nr:hypothetical protein ATW78_06955 [Oenococcus oeni]OIL34693.1 hypothetical protein ATX08_07025 [Oenococcus oeni]OLQ35534.1 hypothetical protein ATX09_06520 [Oenococcus oeni]
MNLNLKRFENLSQIILKAPWRNFSTRSFFIRVILIVFLLLIYLNKYFCKIFYLDVSIRLIMSAILKPETNKGWLKTFKEIKVLFIAFEKDSKYLNL